MKELEKEISKDDLKIDSMFKMNEMEYKKKVIKYTKLFTFF